MTTAASSPSSRGRIPTETSPTGPLAVPTRAGPETSRCLGPMWRTRFGVPTERGTAVGRCRFRGLSMASTSPMACRRCATFSSREGPASSRCVRPPTAAPWTPRRIRGIAVPRASTTRAPACAMRSCSPIGSMTWTSTSASASGPGTAVPHSGRPRSSRRPTSTSSSSRAACGCAWGVRPSSGARRSSSRRPT